MDEYIEREAAIAAIMSEPPDAHYPQWYADKIKAIPAADVATVRHGHWIPVTERLPREDGYYLVTINYFGDHQCIDIRCFAKDGETVDEYDLAGQKYVWYFYDSEYGYVPTDFVTHWMPLPEQPKEVS